MELEFISNRVKPQRRICVDEGLYDFTDEELQFIHESRLLEENCDFHTFLSRTDDHCDRGKHNTTNNHNHYPEQVGEFSESEYSDTESAQQWKAWNRDNFNDAFLEDDDHHHVSVGMISSCSNSDFSEMETNSDYDSDHVKDAIKEMVVTNARPEPSKNHVDHLSSQNQIMMKRIVPEAWLSDPNYFVESDESFDEKDQKVHPLPKHENLRSRISVVASRLIPNLFSYRHTKLNA